MPKPIVDLRPPPSIIYGVWNRYGQLAIPSDVREHLHRVGYKIYPSFGTPNVLIVPRREELAEQLVRAEAGYARYIDASRREALTMKHVMEGRTFTSARISSYHYAQLQFTMENGSYFRIERTRWHNHPLGDDVIRNAPFTVRKVLANGRAIRLEDGTSMEFPYKMELCNHTVPIELIEEIYRD